MIFLACFCQNLLLVGLLTTWINFFIRNGTTWINERVTTFPPIFRCYQTGQMAADARGIIHAYAFSARSCLVSNLLVFSQINVQLAATCTKSTPLFFHFPIDDSSIPLSSSPILTIVTRFGVDLTFLDPARERRPKSRVGDDQGRRPNSSWFTSRFTTGAHTAGLPVERR